MKKTLVSALTTALVVGAASTTFAAANPFEDVPADHWAYDAVAQLAADGVIEGYGDGTYRGDQEITRYEMAQMVARAMAKGGGDKALIDKLAAEFADELNNLGVRVAALEKKVDNVKWPGRIRYRYIHRSNEGSPENGVRDKTNVNQILLRFEPEMTINEHWKGKARLDYAHATNMDDAKNEDKVTVDRIFVTGTYDNFQIKLGKLPYKTQADYGLILDRYFSGASLTFGKNVMFTLNGGRANDDDDKLISFGEIASASAPGASQLGKLTATYIGAEIYNNRKNKFTWGIGWHQFRQGQEMKALIDHKSYSIFALGLGYKFNPDLELTGAYSHASSIGKELGVWDWSKQQKRSYAFQLNYKGAKAGKPGSWGAYLAYRHLGAFSSTGWNTYKLNGPQDSGTRGFELGLSWAPMKNVVGKLEWFSGKNLKPYAGEGKNTKVNAIFTEWSFIF